MKTLISTFTVASVCVLLCAGDVLARGGRGAGAPRRGGVSRPGSPTRSSAATPSGIRSPGGAVAPSPGSRGGTAGADRLGNHPVLKGPEAARRGGNLGTHNPPLGLHDLHKHLGTQLDPTRAADQRPDRPGSRQQPLPSIQQHGDEIRSSFQTHYGDLFTPAWYAQHPNAWHLSHPHADAFAVATVALARGWLGLAATSPMTYTSSVVYENDGADEDDVPAPAADSDVDAAEEVVDQHVTADSSSAQWLPLGVFALVQGGQKDANVMVRLLVSKEGVLQGSYYDALSGSALPLAGSIDRESQRVTWTVGESRTPIFETRLGDLVEDQGLLLVHFGQGRTQQWALVRLAKPARQD